MLDQRLRWVGIEIGKNHRDDLRMLGLDQIGERARILGLHRIDAGRIVAELEAPDEAAGAFRAERLVEHAVEVVLGANPRHAVLRQQVDELAQHATGGVFGHLVDPRHRHRELI